MTQYLGGTRHFLLLTLYNFKNIGGWRAGAPCSAVPVSGMYWLYCASQRFSGVNMCSDLGKKNIVLRMKCRALFIRLLF